MGKTAQAFGGSGGGGTGTSFFFRKKAAIRMVFCFLLVIQITWLHTVDG